MQRESPRSFPSSGWGCPVARWLYAIIALPMLIALVAMDYHFVSDVVAGSVLGAIVGAWSVILCRAPD